MHQVEYECKVRDGGVITLDLDMALDPDEREDFIISEIKDSFENESISDIEIINIKELN